MPALCCLGFRGQPVAARTTCVAISVQGSLPSVPSFPLHPTDTIPRTPRWTMEPRRTCELPPRQQEATTTTETGTTTSNETIQRTVRPQESKTTPDTRKGYHSKSAASLGHLYYRPGTCAEQEGPAQDKYTVNQTPANNNAIPGIEQLYHTWGSVQHRTYRRIRRRSSRSRCSTERHRSSRWPAFSWGRWQPSAPTGRKIRPPLG